MSDVVLVIPCYNEAARLPTAAVRAFLAESPRVSLLFVDDGSTDATGAVLAALAREESRCAVLTLGANVGKAEAVRAGVRAALEGQPQYVGYWDADLAAPLTALTDFVNVLESRPALVLALGSRVQLLGRAIIRGSARHYIGRGFATLVSLMLGLRVYDTQCGAKLFRAGGELRALFERPFTTAWLFDVELLARIIRQRDGDRVAAAAALYEIPLHEWRDVAGSRVRWVDGLRALIDIPRVWTRYLAPGRRQRVRPRDAT